MARMIVVEACPQCGSLDVRATEPRWFQVEFDRRSVVDEGWVELLEFECRGCRLVWS